MNSIFNRSHFHAQGILNLNTILRFILTIVGIILTLIIAPLRQNIERSENRIERIEQIDLPELKKDQQLFRVEMMEFKTRQENQIETLKKIAEDVEYLRRKSK